MLWYVILIFPITPTRTNQLQELVDLQQITESRPHLENNEYFQIELIEPNIAENIQKTQTKFCTR